MQIATLPTPDQRRPEILARVRHAFAEKGFDGASMQDLARAAGISPGNFYRYFPSKAAIVEALIAGDLAEMALDFATVIASAHPMTSLRALLHRRIPEHQNSEDGQLWAEITAAALRKPDICAAACTMETQIVQFLNTIFAAQTGLSNAALTARFPAHAAYIITLFKAAAMIPANDPAQRAALTALLMRNIDTMLDEITAHSQKA